MPTTTKKPTTTEPTTTTGILSSTRPGPSITKKYTTKTSSTQKPSPTKTRRTRRPRTTRRIYRTTQFRDEKFTSGELISNVTDVVHLVAHL